MKAVLHTDGASSGNPGISGIGAVLELDGRTIEISENIGIATNNVAEYSAFIRGLEEALKLGVRELDARLDSELLVRQVKGQYKVKNEHLRPLYQEAMRLIGSFGKCSIRHVRREQNTHADALSKKAIKAPKPAVHGSKDNVPKVHKPKGHGPAGHGPKGHGPEGQGALPF